MPIVFVHGVANRSDSPDYSAGLQSIERLLREYVCPIISPTDAAGVEFIAPYWGGVGVRFAWNRVCCPAGILGMGGGGNSPLETAIVLASEQRLRESIVEPTVKSSGSGLLPQGPQNSPATGGALSLKTLTSEQISDLAVTIVNGLSGKTEIEKSRLRIAADLVAHDPAFLAGLATKSSPQAESEWMLQCIQAKLLTLPDNSAALGMGAMDRFKDALGETLSRAVSLPGSAATHVLAEVRRWLNGFITLFLGDVFTYIANRKTPDLPGDIPEIVLTALREAKRLQTQRPGEPLVVITHSMGGQVVYDLVTSFLPAIYEKEGIRVDFWCATASQVALFEEMKLFLKSDSQYCAANGNKAPYPPDQTLGAWWNVWDPNDFLSFTAKDIFEGVLDESYDSGLSVAEAHGGYLKRPSFYRRLATRIESSRTKGWK
jgi:hypothetical protein